MAAVAGVMVGFRIVGGLIVRRRYWPWKWIVMGAPGSGPPVAETSPGSIAPRDWRAASTWAAVAEWLRTGVSCWAPPGGTQPIWNVPPVGPPAPASRCGLVVSS